MIYNKNWYLYLLHVIRIGIRLDNILSTFLQVFIPLFQRHCCCSLIDEDIKSVEYDEIRLQKRPSYFYLQKHVDGFNIMKDELSINPSDSQLHNQLQNFMKPETNEEWKQSYNQLVKLSDVMKW